MVDCLKTVVMKTVVMKTVVMKTVVMKTVVTRAILTAKTAIVTARLAFATHPYNRQRM